MLPLTDGGGITPPEGNPVDNPGEGPSIPPLPPSVTPDTKIRDIAELKRLLPEIYHKMLEMIGMDSSKQLRKHQERMKKKRIEETRR